MNIYNVLVDKGYRLLGSTRILIGFSQWTLLITVFSTLTFEYKSSPMLIATAASLYALPTLLIGPIFGRLADSRPPYQMLIYIFIARIIATLLLFLSDTPELLLGLLFLRGVSNTPYGPTEQVLFRRLIPSNIVPDCIAINNLIDQTTKISAPVLAGLLFFTFGSKGSFIAIAVLEALALVVFLLYREKLKSITHPISQTSNPSVSLFSRFTGIGPLSMELKAFIAAAAGGAFVLFAYDPQLAKILDLNGFGAKEFGTIVGATAAGAVCASFFMSSFVRRWKTGKILITIFSAFSIILALIYLTTQYAHGLAFWPYLILWGLNGAVYSSLMMSHSFAIQRLCPPNSIGATSAASRSLQMLSMVIVPPVAAFLLGSNPPIVLIASGAIIAMSGMLIGIIVMISKSRRIHSQLQVDKK